MGRVANPKKEAAAVWPPLWSASGMLAVIPRAAGGLSALMRLCRPKRGSSKEEEEKCRRRCGATLGRKASFLSSARAVQSGGPHPLKTKNPALCGAFAEAAGLGLEPRLP